MPVFDYRCAECGKTYDVFHKGKEILEDIVCPACGSSHHTKLISAPAISMNGRTVSTPDSGGGCPGGMCGLN